MNTCAPSLLRGRDSLVGEPLRQHQVMIAALSSCVSVKLICKTGRSSSAIKCNSSFGEVEVADCSLKFGESTSLRIDQNISSSRNRSERLVAMASSSIAPAESPQEDWEGCDEFDHGLMRYRGLVLDLSYRPINIVCWRRALCLEILEKADVLQYYDQVISSPTRPFPIPAVLRITDYVYSPVRSKVKLTLKRKNIFLRDDFKCQYCGSQDNLTVDHVIPFSRGGKWTWRNLVTACSNCNVRKGNKTLEESKMQLRRAPREPREIYGDDLPSTYAAFRSMQNAKRVPTEWVGYLPKRFYPADYF
ncbi:hypothetical protein KP509_14G021800 [Ceratopteris richardii]|uniref:HNH nuclease domain-containing protein n=1 Tax=Ceratopteris richardii TaxID=49495 RepID=A0A8T2T8F6_CERRI|nr:hypothetical protein KP509_14G021800 [Ceratopteris richardii]